MSENQFPFPNPLIRNSMWDKNADFNVPVVSPVGCGPKGEKGDKGDPFKYTDFTKEQIDSIKKGVLFADNRSEDAVVTTIGDSTTNITIPVNYEEFDMLFIDVNGLDLAEHEDYEIVGDKIVLTVPLPAGQEVHFRSLKYQLPNTDKYINITDNRKDYNTVAEMQADTELEPGDICHTLGFHAAGDGGTAWYKIHSHGAANGMDIIALENSCVAFLQIAGDYVTPEMFGAYGDGVHDDTNKIEKALKITKTILGFNKTYKCDAINFENSKINLIGNNSTIYVEPKETETDIFVFTNCDVYITDINFESEESIIGEPVSGHSYSGNYFTSNCNMLIFYNCGEVTVLNTNFKKSRYDTMFKSIDGISGATDKAIFNNIKSIGSKIFIDYSYVKEYYLSNFFIESSNINSDGDHCIYLTGGSFYNVYICNGTMIQHDEGYPAINVYHNYFDEDIIGNIYIDNCYIKGNGLINLGNDDHIVNCFINNIKFEYINQPQATNVIIRSLNKDNYIFINNSKLEWIMGNVSFYVLGQVILSNSVITNIDATTKRFNFNNLKAINCIFNYLGVRITSSSNINIKQIFESCTFNSDTNDDYVLTCRVSNAEIYLYDCEFNCNPNSSYLVTVTNVENEGYLYIYGAIVKGISKLVNPNTSADSRAFVKYLYPITEITVPE